uniref:Uncharacterized protein n=1 Tax=Arundo donax TaxID=35708 RepID=A0A0A9A4L5_ARUDO
MWTPPTRCPWSSPSPMAPRLCGL